MNISRLLVKVANRLDQSQQEHAILAANAIDMAVSEAGESDDGVISSLCQFANWLDVDGHVKTAEVLDVVVDTLMTRIAADRNSKSDRADLYDSKKHRTDSLFNSLVEEVKKAEPELDTWRDGGHPLLTRYSPDYPGVMLLRVSDGVYQDMLTKKVYDFRTGFISDTGVRYYGGSTAHQTPIAGTYVNSPALMDSKHLQTRPR